MIEKCELRFMPSLTSCIGARDREETNIRMWINEVFMNLHRSNCLRDLSTLQMERCNGGASRKPLLILIPSEFHLDPLIDISNSASCEIEFMLLCLLRQF